MDEDEKGHKRIKEMFVENQTDIKEGGNRVGTIQGTITLHRTPEYG